jgi:hypothetical protein
LDGFSRQGTSLQNAFILLKSIRVPEAGLAFDFLKPGKENAGKQIQEMVWREKGAAGP